MLRQFLVRMQSGVECPSARFSDHGVDLQPRSMRFTFMRETFVLCFLHRSPSSQVFQPWDSFSSAWIYGTTLTHSTMIVKIVLVAMLHHQHCLPTLHQGRPDGSDLGAASRTLFRSVLILKDCPITSCHCLATLMDTSMCSAPRQFHLFFFLFFRLSYHNHLQQTIFTSKPQPNPPKPPRSKDGLYD